MTNRTRTAFSIVLVLPAIVFVLTGLRWWVDPTAAADQLGMPLLNGLVCGGSVTTKGRANSRQTPAAGPSVDEREMSGYIFFSDKKLNS
jgi:hypothetical protein